MSLCFHSHALPFLLRKYIMLACRCNLANARVFTTLTGVVAYHFKKPRKFYVVLVQFLICTIAFSHNTVS